MRRSKATQDGLDKDKLQDTVTETVLEVLRSLNLLKPQEQKAASTEAHIAKSQNDNRLFGSSYKPYSSSSFGMSNYRSTLDDVLSESSMLPIHRVAGARRSFAGMKSSGVSKGAMDFEKIREAAIGTGEMGSGFGRGTPGLQMEPLTNNVTGMFNYSLSRTNPYMTNRIYSSGMYGDMPIYFWNMQQQNGGVLYWPIHIREKYQWYRYFYRTDPYVGAIIDLHTDLPVSRIGFTMPKLRNDPDGSRAKSCLKRCQKWGDEIGLYDRIQEAIFEWTLIGNAYNFCEWDSINKWWSKLTLLPPEEVGIVHFPFSDLAYAEYRPEPLIQLIENINVGSIHDSSPIDRAVYENIPQDIINSIAQYGTILMDTDPMTGSFVAHLARKRSSYADLGVSTLERCIVPLLQKEHFKYTQLSLSSRLMTPRNKISAPGISPDATDNLRTEIDMSMEDPDYHVVTNFDFSWDQIGAENRLIQLQPEYERIENEIFAALGATKEMITGEASYGGAKVTAEILNTRYLLVREVFKNFVEKKLLKTMAIANDWYEEDENGDREYYYPMLTFNRLTIRDNQEMFDALFQLYQKGSLPVQVIYELFNLNPAEMNEVLVDDMFTVRDSTFNEMLRQVHTDLGSKLVDATDVLDRVVKYCGLTAKDEDGKISMIPVMDTGENLFSAPQTKDDGNADKEDLPAEPDATDATENNAEESSSGGLDETLNELGGSEQPEEGAPSSTEEMIEEE